MPQRFSSGGQRLGEAAAARISRAIGCVAEDADQGPAARRDQHDVSAPAAPHVRHDRPDSCRRAELVDRLVRLESTPAYEEVTRPRRYPRWQPAGAAPDSLRSPRRLAALEAFGRLGRRRTGRPTIRCDELSTDVLSNLRLSDVAHVRSDGLRAQGWRRSCRRGRQHLAVG